MPETPLSGARLDPLEEQEAVSVRRELDKIMVREMQPWSRLGLLLLSALLFVGVGMRSGRWSGVLMLAGVIFIHEMGHYLAMKHFGYRKLKMFFIPMLGAATSGQQAHPDGRQAAIVSLMGPVPGIFIGLVLLIAGLRVHTPVILQLAMTFLLLNLLNLLPVSPLDGGHFFAAILFNRHPLLEVFFNMLATIALILWAATSRIPMAPVAVILVMNLIAGYRRSQVAYRLKKTLPAPPESDNPDYIPSDWIRLLVKEVKSTHVGGLSSSKPSAKVLALYCKDVWQKMRLRQPSWAAALALLAAYVATIAIVALLPGRLRRFVKPVRTAAPVQRTNPAVAPVLLPNEVKVAGKTVLVPPAPWHVAGSSITAEAAWYRLELAGSPSNPAVTAAIGWLSAPALGTAGRPPDPGPLAARLERLEAMTAPPSSAALVRYGAPELKAIKQSGHPAWAVIRSGDSSGRRFKARDRIIPYAGGAVIVSDRADENAPPAAVNAALLPLLQALQLP